MNIIEQLGGYARAIKMSKEWESSIDGDIPLDTMMYSYDFGIFSCGDLQSALLEYRRQHNIYEIDDYVVYQGDAGLSGLFRIEKLTKTGKPKSVKSNRFGGFPCRYCEVRHATPEEIKAGKRL